MGEFKMRNEETRNCESALVEAEMQQNQAMVALVSSRQKRDELKAEASLAREARRPARIAAKEATTERQAVLAEFMKVEKAQVKMEEAKSSAVDRLKKEAYDANQVEHAYEHKRRMEAGG